MIVIVASCVTEKLERRAHISVNSEAHVLMSGIPTARSNNCYVTLLRTADDSTEKRDITKLDRAVRCLFAMLTTMVMGVNWEWTITITDGIVRTKRNRLRLK